MTSTCPDARPGLPLMLTSLFRADLIVLVKYRMRMVLSLFLPLVLLFATDSDHTTGRLGGPLFIIGLSISYGLASTSIMGYALTVARDRENGVLRRLHVTPAPSWLIMGSRLLVQALANLVIALVAVIVGSQMHHLTLSAGQYALVLGISVIGGAVFLSVGQAIVGLVKSADTVNSMARIVYFALILLGLFGASGVLGSAWESIARWTPVGALMTLFAGVLSLSAWSVRDSLSLLACGGYIVVCAAIGIRWFRWDAR